jgi:hypothetical protein
MRMKTNELIGPALDWAVAKCEGMSNLRPNPHRFDQRLIMDGPEGNGVFLQTLNYSTDWAQGGPIIDRCQIATEHDYLSGWIAAYSHPVCGFGKRGYFHQTGPTPLIAAMRCYVASKLGDDIDVPEELKS